MLRYEVHAATDVTGFGLAGHGFKMADGSRVTLQLEESDLPIMAGALELCREGMVPGGGKRNREYYGPHVKTSDEVASEVVEIVFDPQTSGGLLIAVPQRDALALLGDLHAVGATDASVIGAVRPRGDFALELH
jgi:selenide,water dikinase